MRTASRAIPRRCLATAAGASQKPHVGILLKRDPIILRQLTEFEHAYYAYRDSIEQGESRPFNPEFYFKKGSTAEQRWLAAQESATEKTPSGKLRIVQPRDEEVGSLDAANRATEADAKKDMKSLDRALDRTLYLVVKRAAGPMKGTWQLPSGALEADEVLHDGATRHLHEEVGSALETWVVGKTPVGHLVSGNEKIFYMKAHILSGKIQPNGKLASDYAWATKQELKEYLKPEQYATVSKMMAEL
ncbi:39S mitochondrial ribosomal protein L46-domain-containing protein [Powellomyces hirtus]|nr:39S mitochondrial ribosomal protein L46-domain-containing protein [Powellomyces hirtus]